MYYKLCSFLFIFLLGCQVGCQTEQAAKNISGNDNKQITETKVSEEDIKQMFIDSGLGEGDGNLEKLMALPRERVVAVVQKIKTDGVAKESYEGESQSLKIKSAYFLWKLGVDTESNEKFIVDAAKDKDISLKFDALGYLGIIASKGKKEYLPMIFKSAPQADGAYAMDLLGFFVDELQNSPKIFLQYLSGESLQVRKRVYKLVSLADELSGEGTLEEIKQKVEKLKEDKALKNIAGEFLREVGKRRLQFVNPT